MVDRLREIDELERNFLMRVTHELRTPLTAISGHVQAVSEGMVEPEDMDDSLTAVNEEVRRLERLVNDLLDLTRLEAHQFRVVQEEVGLEALLEQAAAGFREIARANEVDFDTTTAARPDRDHRRRPRLQIVTNLLDNAFRWTPRGGTVKLALRHLERRRGDHRHRHRARASRRPTTRRCSTRSTAAAARAAPASGSRIARELASVLWAAGWRSRANRARARPSRSRCRASAAGYAG